MRDAVHHPGDMAAEPVVCGHRRGIAAFFVFEGFIHFALLGFHGVGAQFPDRVARRDHAVAHVLGYDGSGTD